jgi:3-hydroxy-9,10-secoandrosta-1,3,5(10)-triene-9,17-dione monooxygenase
VLTNDSTVSPRDRLASETEEAGSTAYDAVVERAASLAPLLRERASEAEVLRQLPEDVITALRRAGMFRMVQPKRVGGLGLAPTALFDVGSALGRGCASASWVVGNLAVHNMHLAFFPAEAQALLWGQAADVLIGSSNIFKSGIARKVDAGYLLRGRWPFSSGIHHCSWTTLGGQVPMEDGKPAESRYFLLSKDQYRILDTWRTAGLRGTGSADIEIHRQLDCD